MYAWRPIPPDDNFVALGMVVTTNHKMPALNLVRCVPRGVAPLLMPRFGIFDMSITSGGGGFYIERMSMVSYGLTWATSMVQGGKQSAAVRLG